jgi:corrinoid protein of di/trimethylamine methyltransferase
LEGTNLEEKELFEKLKSAVVEGNDKEIKKLSQLAIDNGVDAYRALINGCAKGMDVVSDKYEKKEMFVPEILLSARAMYAALDVLMPHLKAEESKNTGTVMIGVVEGDIHDIGKNIVSLLLKVGGFEVVDLGKNVPLKTFVEKAKETKPDIIGLSALMTTSMMGMPEVIGMMKDAGIRDQVKILIGGAPISQKFADQIGADGYAPTGPSAIKAAEKLIGGN